MQSTLISDTRLGHKLSPERRSESPCDPFGVKGLIPEEVRTIISEFIAEIGQIPSLLCAILYGSTVRDELHDESDIDVFLLFDTDHNPEFGEELSMVARIGVAAAMRVDSYYDFSFVMSNVSELDTMDPGYLEHLVEEGIVIWARPHLITPLAAFSNRGRVRAKPEVVGSPP